MKNAFLVSSMLFLASCGALSPMKTLGELPTANVPSPSADVANTNDSVVALTPMTGPIGKEILALRRERSVQTSNASALRRVMYINAEEASAETLVNNAIFQKEMQNKTPVVIEVSSAAASERMAATTHELFHFSGTASAYIVVPDADTDSGLYIYPIEDSSTGAVRTSLAREGTSSESEGLKLLHSLFTPTVPHSDSTPQNDSTSQSLAFNPPQDKQRLLQAQYETSAAPPFNDRENKLLWLEKIMVKEGGSGSMTPAMWKTGAPCYLGGHPWSPSKYCTIPNVPGVPSRVNHNDGGYGMVWSTDSVSHESKLQESVSEPIFDNVVWWDKPFMCGIQTHIDHDINCTATYTTSTTKIKGSVDKVDIGFEEALETEVDVNALFVHFKGSVTVTAKQAYGHEWKNETSQTFTSANATKIDGGYAARFGVGDYHLDVTKKLHGMYVGGPATPHGRNGEGGGPNGYFVWTQLWWVPGSTVKIAGWEVDALGVKAWKICKQADAQCMQKLISGKETSDHFPL